MFCQKHKIKVVYSVLESVIHVLVRLIPLPFVEMTESDFTQTKGP